jgi:hypothetical protein
VPTSSAAARTSRRLSTGGLAAICGQPQTFADGSGRTTAEQQGGAIEGRPWQAMIAKLEGRGEARSGESSVCALRVPVFEFATTPDVEAS